MAAQPPSPLCESPGLVVVMTTAPSPDHAHALARALVEEGLAACVNILPQVRSVYVWQGAVCDEPEVVCLMKTTKDHLAELVARLQERHPYELPEVVVLEAAQASAAYAAWVTDATSGRAACQGS